MNTLNMSALVVSVNPGGVTQILEVWQMRVQMHGPKTDQRSEERLIQDEKILDFASLAVRVALTPQGRFVRPLQLINLNF